ncbi:unnamed protein product [Ceutorhynchus assimilis]|uniref:BESS domain-containing protein n=1 Tax=Ceutorhynchus assimilis TaxID=467358 RepID=A0A9N9MUZ0_9CUCU|nr:unnamed protein product [Ceutorhynchus assimilis]
MKQTCSVLQKRWKNIRDRYSREIKKNQGKSGKGQKGKSAYKYTSQLWFLNDVIQRLPADASMDDIKLETGLAAETSTSTVYDEPSAEHVTKKRKGNIVERKRVEALASPNINQEGQIQTINSNEEDDRLFLLSLVPFLKSIPPHSKLAARMDIMQSINKFMTVQFPAPTL